MIMHPINVARSNQVKQRAHILCLVSWWTWYFISVIVLYNLFNSTQPGTGGAAWLVGALTACIAFLVTLPLMLWLSRHSLRDYSQDDFPILPKPIGPLPAWVARDKPHLVENTALLVSNYPMVALLDEDWLERYRFLPDEALAEAKSDMCSEVAHNWAVSHPNAPVSARRPAWFENLEEQAEALLWDLQRCYVVSDGDPATEDAEGYFRKHGRWPDEWYEARGMAIPAPGPDPDWFMPSSTGVLINASIIAGAVYMGGWRPIKKFFQ